MKEKIQRYFNLNYSVKVINNGIKESEFTGKEITDKIYNFAWGRFVPEKGFQILLKSINLLPPEYRFVIAGYGAMYGEYIRIIRKFRLENRAIILNKTSRKKILYFLFNCKFVVVASNRENFPLNILEAMSANKAIVSSKVGGIPEILKEGKNGLFFNINNRKEMIEKIKIMWENDNLRKKIEKNNLKKVKLYTWSKIADEYLNFYTNG